MPPEARGALVVPRPRPARGAVEEDEGAALAPMGAVVAEGAAGAPDPSELPGMGFAAGWGA